MSLSINKNTGFFSIIFLLLIVHEIKAQTTIKYFTSTTQLEDSSLFTKAELLEIYPPSSASAYVFNNYSEKYFSRFINVRTITFYEGFVASDVNQIIHSINATEIIFNGCSFITDKIKFPKSLKYIQFVNCNIKNLNTNFLNRSTITAVTLSGCDLKLIPEPIFKMKHLQLLDLANKEIGNLSYLKNPSIKFINLNNCGIKTQQAIDLLNNLSGLQSIQLRNNSIENDSICNLLKSREIKQDICP